MFTTYGLVRLPVWFRRAWIRGGTWSAGSNGPEYAVRDSEFCALRKAAVTLSTELALSRCGAVRRRNHQEEAKGRERDQRAKDEAR